MIIEADVIDYDNRGDQEIIAKGNEIINKNTGETLLEFEHQVIEGIHIINKDAFYGSDLWGNRKVLKSSKVIDVPYVVKSVITEDLSIVLFKKRKTTAKIDLNGNIHWEHPFFPVLGGILTYYDLIVLLEGAGTFRKRLHFAKISTGEILSSFDCGENVPRLLGADSKIVWIASKEEKYIKSIDPRTGQLLDEVSSGSIQELLEHQIDIEYFKFDAKSLNLIQPLGDFKLASKSFVKRNYFESLVTDGDVWVPSVFPFSISDKYLTFGFQVDNSKTKETKTRLIVIQRVDDFVIVDVSINVERPDAGLKKVALTKEKLTYIDSFNNLHQLPLNQLA